MPMDMEYLYKVNKTACKFLEAASEVLMSVYLQVEISFHSKLLKHNKVQEK